MDGSDPLFDSIKQLCTSTTGVNGVFSPKGVEAEVGDIQVARLRVEGVLKRGDGDALGHVVLNMGCGDRPNLRQNYQGVNIRLWHRETEKGPQGTIIVSGHTPADEGGLSYSLMANTPLEGQQKQWAFAPGSEPLVQRRIDTAGQQPQFEPVGVEASVFIQEALSKLTGLVVANFNPIPNEQSNIIASSF